eukprot:COSAG05_NODE_3398_length_2086_cov_3.031706_1_plen_152_part_00
MIMVCCRAPAAEYCWEACPMLFTAASYWTMVQPTHTSSRSHNLRHTRQPRHHPRHTTTNRIHHRAQRRDKPKETERARAESASLQRLSGVSPHCPLSSAFATATAPASPMLLAAAQSHPTSTLATAMVTVTATATVMVGLISWQTVVRQWR